MKPFKYIIIACSIILLNSCSDKKQEVKEKEKNSKRYYLELLSSDETHITFRNTVKEDDIVNFLYDEAVYNGSGVGVGDINNDGLADIYFAGNSSDDQLYLNKGNFEFLNITEQAGIAKYAKGWSTGVNFVDINNDGFLDIYVCRSGPFDDLEMKANRLFINNRNNTFTEASESYGLNSTEQSRQSSFFDYDLDGDLDMYLMNRPKVGFKPGMLNDYLSKIKSGELRTDYFYENVDGKYVEKTREAGLMGFGYGHSVTVSDLNDDGFPDLYVCRDYDDPDFLYINNGDKTFRDETSNSLNHLSYSSMGSDIADINNDGLLDIIALDMAPYDHIRSKTSMKSMNPEKFFALANNNFGYQYMFNTLHLNQGHNEYSEIAQMAGIAKTDWSWSPLFMDIDNDGFKDLIISNGIKRNFLIRDLKQKLDELSLKLKRRPTMDELHVLLPRETTDNIVYRNSRDLTFDDFTKEWMDSYSFNTNGMAYADFDNDGDLDLVTNNMESVAGLYRNTSSESGDANYIRFKLLGDEKNPFAIGSKIVLNYNDIEQKQELQNARGYLSSVNYELTFGLGDKKAVDRVEITWPDGSVRELANVEANQTYEISFSDGENKLKNQKINIDEGLLKAIDPVSIGINFVHQENQFDDYKNQVLLPYSQSRNGPFIDKADVNGDALEDFFIGGAKGQPGALFLQTENGSFKKTPNTIWELDKEFEDLGVLFFDADNDGDKDLYVVSGGSEFVENSAMYQDRLYLNNGQGKFSKSKGLLPEILISGQCVRANDIDNDGDLDLFVGGRIIPDKYPYAPNSLFLVNNGGKFIDKTNEIAPELTSFGMVSSAIFSDFDNDGDDDLITLGEWSKINFHRNENGRFVPIDIPGLVSSRGLWFSISEIDLDNDGDLDYIAGNLGLNSKFKVNDKKEFHVFCDDFDSSGTYDIILSSNYHGSLVPVRGKECSTQQLPGLKNKFGSFQSFAEADLGKIIGTENLSNALHYQLDLLSSIAIINNGKGDFEMRMLPNEAQLAPLMSAQFVDLDNDGIREIISVGNHYSVEVETVRFDASKGLVMKSSAEGFIPIGPNESGLYASKDAKSSVIINNLLIVANNDAQPSVFKLK